jgi:hypothetical protein
LAKARAAALAAKAQAKAAAPEAEEEEARDEEEDQEADADEEDGKEVETGAEHLKEDEALGSEVMPGNQAEVVRSKALAMRSLRRQTTTAQQFLAEWENLMKRGLAPEHLEDLDTVRLEGALRDDVGRVEDADGKVDPRDTKPPLAAARK